MKRFCVQLLVLFSLVVSARAVEFIELSDAVDAESLVWETGGGAEWFGQTGWTVDGEDAAQSGYLTGVGQSWIQTTVTGPCTVSFWWGCEADGIKGSYRFTVDGVEQFAVGDVWYSDWEQKKTVLSEGTHTLRWVLDVKYSYWDDGYCSCWLDQVVIGGPVITLEPLDAVVVSGETASLRVKALGDEPLAYQWFEGVCGDDSSPVADATNALFDAVGVLADTLYWVRVSNDKGEAESRTARVRIGFGVYTLADLQHIGSDTNEWSGWTLDAAYLLMNDIDASETATWNDAGTDESVLEGFAPIGASDWYYDPKLGDWTEGFPFTGMFDGKGHVIRGLMINRPESYYVGLFGYTLEDASIQNVGVVGGEIMGWCSVGGLVGWNYGRIFGCFAASSVSGTWDVGGVVGCNYGVLEQSYACGNVSGEETVGGLAGYNPGTIMYCYGALSVKGGKDDVDVGGLIGYSWGLTGNSYWDTEYSGQEKSGGGEGKTSEEMRHQATYAGWDFDTVWGIQEGVGTPYLKQFADGHTEHETPPATGSPANMSFVWDLRPAMTGLLTLAGCDYVNARWQVATASDFSDASDWMGYGEDGPVLNASFGTRVPVADALSYGQMYYWRVRVQTGYGMWSDWSMPALFLVWKPSDPLVAGKDELSVWREGVLSRVWQTDYLFDAHDDFAAAIQQSGTNYEARILRALTTLAKLSEDSELRGLLADFGYTFDEGLFALTGRFAEAASPLPNDTVDRIVNQALPAIDLAAADLAAIPTNWTGTVALTPADFPVDETVYLDIGDVLFARAALGGARAAAETAQAYDLTLDYGKTNICLAHPVAQALDVTLDGDESEWTNTPPVLFGEKAQLEYAKIARSATQIHVLARLADGVYAQSFWFEIGTSTNAYRFWYNGLLEGVLPSEMDDPCSLFYLGNVIEVTYDIPAEEQGEDFHLFGMGVEYPNPLPAPAPEVAVTEDGIASEWSDVPAAPLTGGYIIDEVKVARSASRLHVLMTLQDGWTFDAMSYFWISVSTFSGGAFGFGDWSDGVTYFSQGGVLEVSCPIPAEDLEESFFLTDVEVWSSDFGVIAGGCGEVYDGSDYKWFDWESWDEESSEDEAQPLNQFLADHPACMNTVRNPGKLPSAKASLREALALASAADAAITGRSDGLMHFFEYDPVQSNEQAEARQRLHEAQASMDAPTTVTYSNRTETVFLGAAFDAPYLTRNLLPRLTDEDEIVVGTFPDPTFNGILPNMTQASWQDELQGRVPLVKERAFTLDGQTFTTGGYAFWDVAEEAGGETTVAVSGLITNACRTWAETTLTGPGTLTFSWAVSSHEKVDILSVYVDGVRQLGSLSGESGWGPRQLVLPAGTHRVRWAYVRNEGGGLGEDGGLIDGLSWASSAPASTDTPVRVPYTWLDGFDGLVQGGDYEAAAWDDQDGDGKKTWEEFVSGTTPTNKASVFLATISKGGASLEIGWTPDLGPLRSYTVEGKTRLSEAEWAPTNAASRFFRVKVQMP